MRKLTALGALTVLGGVLLSGLAAAQYSGGLIVSDTTVQPGDPVTVSGDGYQGGTTVTITLESAPRTLGTATADGSGFFRATVTIPLDTSPGSHTLKATGQAAGGGTLVLSAPITVLGETTGGGGAGGTGGVAEPATAREADDLAFTGQNIVLLIVAVGGLTMVGSGLLRAARTRAQAGGSPSRSRTKKR